MYDFYNSKKILNIMFKNTLEYSLNILLNKLSCWFSELKSDSHYQLINFLSLLVSISYFSAK